MKINLTMLLELPARVKIINEDYEKHKTGSPAILSKEKTSPERTYSFELKKRNQQTGEIESEKHGN